MLKVFTIGSINAINAIVHHGGYKKIVKDGLRFWVMFFYKVGYGINGLWRRGNNTDVAPSVKLNEFFCFCWK
ncbi:hypothetical protein HKBW3S33_01824 [Candidatus Hakubella thermalkaliphila]|uniref:Uncharacterized protein n=1 Tax=Candidatus Hakubella thermalkaliphila TaxID=2754717 RepID=A0A6V8P720_9ACTN|nr:hypothetical protein HKBW3S33_01824 [Candidatus Hakubella thermalkaliphila]